MQKTILLNGQKEILINKLSFEKKKAKRKKTKKMWFDSCDDDK